MDGSAYKGLHIRLGSKSSQTPSRSDWCHVRPISARRLPAAGALRMQRLVASRFGSTIGPRAVNGAALEARVAWCSGGPPALLARVGRRRPTRRPWGGPSSGGSTRSIVRSRHSISSFDPTCVVIDRRQASRLSLVLAWAEVPSPRRFAGRPFAVTAGWHALLVAHFQWADNNNNNNNN